MKKLNKYIFYVVVVLFSLFLFNCDTPENIIAGKFSYQIDQTVNLETFPSNIYLELGKSILIENGMVIFRFIAVLEYSESNSSIRLKIEYDNGIIKTIDLNTQNIPAAYYLENGYNHVIRLKEVTFNDGNYQIMFTYNKYYRL